MALCNPIPFDFLSLLSTCFTCVFLIEITHTDSNISPWSVIVSVLGCCVRSFASQHIFTQSDFVTAVAEFAFSILFYVKTVYYVLCLGMSVSMRDVCLFVYLDVRGRSRSICPCIGSDPIRHLCEEFTCCACERFQAYY